MGEWAAVHGLFLYLPDQVHLQMGKWDGRQSSAKYHTMLKHSEQLVEPSVVFFSANSFPQLQLESSLGAGAVNPPKVPSPQLYTSPVLASTSV